MIKVYLDTNVLLNVWFKETDPRSGRQLWKASLRLLELIENSQIEGIVSIFTIMESIHVFRRKGVNPEIVQEDIQNLGIEVYIPEVSALLDALEYQLDLRLDPYDAVALSSAVNSGSSILITRDEDFRAKAGNIIPIMTPDEFVDKFEEGKLSDEN